MYMYVHVCIYMYMYLHVQIVNMYIHVCTMYRALCTDLQILVHVVRIPDVDIQFRSYLYHSIVQVPLKSYN
jgi:hypothetical protein